MRPIGWRVYYGDGTTADSRRVKWCDAPGRNVQVVVVFYDEQYAIAQGGTSQLAYESYRDILHSQDYYWQDTTGRFGSSTEASDVSSNVAVGAIKVGQLIRDDQWWDIYNAALADHTF